MGRRPIEDVVDEALQSLLDGEPAEAILAHYPGYEAQLTPLLFAASSLKDAPQPQLSQASIATMLHRAEAQAARDRKAPAYMLPTPTSVPLDSSNESKNASRVTRTESVNRQSKHLRQTWQDRVAAWISPASTLLRLPTAFMAVAVAIIALVTIAGLLDKQQPPYPPVPTMSQFTLDGNIDQVASGIWTVDREMVYLDSRTIITGTPMIGSQAHIEGDIASDNRRIARSIVVRLPVAATSTPNMESVASATAQPTVFTLIEDATRLPTQATEVSTLPYTPTLPEITQATPTASKQATAGTRPSPTIPAASGTKPTYITPTRTIIMLPPRTNIAPTVTVSIAKPQPTAIRQPSPIPTSTVQPLPTTRYNEPTPTSVPQPEPTAIIQIEPSHTPEPTSTSEHTPQPHSTATTLIDPTSTVEPEETSTTQPTTVAHPTTTSIPTTEPTSEPEETSTAQPTTAPTMQPTTTVPPISSPSRTEEPHETRTAEPTHGPESTHTGQSTRTPEPTRTEHTDVK